MCVLETPRDTWDTTEKRAFSLGHHAGYHRDGSQLGDWSDQWAFGWYPGAVPMVSQSEIANLRANSRGVLPSQPSRETPDGAKNLVIYFIEEPSTGNIKIGYTSRGARKRKAELEELLAL